MTRKIHRLTYLPGFLLLLCALPAGIRAQTRVTGHVTEGLSERAIAAADVLLTDSLGRNVARGITADDGRFSFSHPGPGTYELSVDRIGYVSTFVVITLQDRVAAEIDITLSVLPIELDPMRVTAEQRRAAMTLGFEGLPARMRRGFGDFIDREQIERRVPSLTSDLFVGGMGVYMTRGDVYFRGTERLIGLHCPPSIWVDGLLVRPPSRDLTLNEAAPSPDAIEAIEVYRRPAGVPVQYNIDGQCGVILIWTRRRGPPDKVHGTPW